MIKRVAPLLLLVCCAPAKSERSVVVAPTSVPTATSSSVVAVTTAPEVPLEKGDVPPGEPIARAPIVHRLASSFYQTCAMRKSGAVVCWGVGALVDFPPYGSSLTAAPRPATIAELNDAVEVAVDPTAGCARRKGGTVACWGKGKAPGGAALERARAIEVPGLASVSRLFTAREGFCALVANELACFNGSGSAIVRKKLPVPGAEVIDAVGSREFACLATNKGAAYCFGDFALGRLGGEPDKDGFARVRDVNDAVAVAVGDYFGCAILSSGYRACWGNSQPLPGGSFSKDYPTVINRARNDVTRAAAGRTTCWLLRSGAVQCEGEGKYGQHGDGSSSSWGRDKVKGVSDALELAIGFEHVCALRANDDVVCWGANDRAQLGDGTLVDRTIPTPVIGAGGKNPPPPPKPGSGPPLAPPKVASATAPWREKDTTGPRRLEGYWGFASRRSPSAVGVRAALFESEGKAVHDAHGVVTVTLPKDRKFTALDGDDAVWVGTKDSFLRAPDVLAAKKGSFQKVLSIPFASAFDVTKGLAVAADASVLHVSRDGGKTFTKVNPKADLTIETVFARDDGLIAIFGLDRAGEHALWIAKDGQTFAPSKLQARDVRQAGSHIYVNGCPGGILSSDGVTWNAWDEDFGAPLGFNGWGGALDIGSRPRAFTTEKLNNLIQPPAPAPSKNVVTGKPGECSKAGVGGIGMGGGGASYRRGGACVGAACVRATLGELPGGTETDVGLYGDGACERDEKGFCKKGPWKRPPHATINGKAPIDLPAGCDPTRLLSAGGIGVLFCERDGTTVVHTIGKDTVFHMESSFGTRFDVDEITIADDGTIVAHPVCGNKSQGDSGTCPGAVIRSPKALGAPNAWRASAVPAPFAFRVLGGGAALVIAAGSDAQRFSLFIDAPDATPKPIAKDLAVLGDLLDVELHKDKIVVVEQVTTRPLTRWYVAADGLVRIDDPKKP